MTTPQAHTQALNKYLITRPENEIFWNNPTGHAYASNQVYKQGDGSLLLKNPRRVSYGLFGKGGPDLVGITLQIITPDMVGQTIPIFSTTEMKQGKDRLRPEQKQWHKILTGHGCISRVILYEDGEFKEMEV